MRPLLALDLDGTLLTCAPRQGAVLRAALRVVGVSAEIDLDAMWRHKREGASTREALEAAGVPSEEALEVAAVWLRTIEDFGWLALDRPFPDVDEGLARLGASRVGLICLTARQRPWWVRLQLKNLGLASRFDEVIVVSPTDAARQKARHLRARGAFAFVGDSESDARAAAEAGVPFAAVSTGQRSERFLRARGCDPVFGAFAEAARWAAGRSPVAPPRGS